MSGLNFLIHELVRWWAGDRDGMSGPEADLVDQMKRVRAGVEVVRRELATAQARACPETQQALGVHLLVLQQEAEEIRTVYEQSGFHRGRTEWRALEHHLRQAEAELLSLRNAS